MPTTQRSTRSRRRTRRRTPENQHETHTPIPQTPERAAQRIQTAPDAAAILTMQRTIGNQATISLLQRASPAGAAKLKSKTGYLGLNPAAKKEAQALKRRLGPDVLISLNDPTTEANLHTPAGMVKWIMDDLGVNIVFNPGTFFGVYETLAKADPAVRDQLGALMKMFYGAEHGKYILERLVMSGHSNGVAMWGEAEPGGQSKSQIILDSDLTAVTKLFPKARDQVQDVMFSACWTVVSVELIASYFPT